MKEHPQQARALELRFEVLNSKLYWINAVFSKNSQIVGTSKIVGEIIVVFSELYNLFALAQNLLLIDQPKPYSHPHKIYSVVTEDQSNRVESDREIVTRTEEWLSGIGDREVPKKIVMPELEDTYLINRKTLPQNATKKTLMGKDGKVRSFYLDSGYSEEDFQKRIKLFDEFQIRLLKIAKAMRIQEDCIQQILTNPRTDAKRLEKDHVLANLMRYEKNKSIFFWLFVISREIAYIKEGRLSYRYMNTLRDVLMTTLEKLNSSE